MTACRIESCDRKIKARQLCSRHYYESLPRPTCEMDGCERKTQSGALCEKHRSRRRYQTRAERGVPPCSVEGCSALSYGKGLCTKHYQRLADSGVLGDYLTHTCRACQGSYQELRGPGSVSPLCPTCRVAYVWCDQCHALLPRVHERTVRRCRRCERLRTLASTYRVDEAFVLALLESQNYACAVCSDPVSLYSPLDHDHSCCPSRPYCGQCCRGVLCNSCNVGIGNLRDRPDLLRAAANYIERLART